MASVRARTIFSNHGLTVTAIESVELRTGLSNRKGLLIGSLRPIAVIVREADRTYALDMNARLVDIERIELPPEFDWE